MAYFDVILIVTTKQQDFVLGYLEGAFIDKDYIGKTVDNEILYKIYVPNNGWQSWKKFATRHNLAWFSKGADDANN